jgi:hypothetical protein
LTNETRSRTSLAAHGASRLPAVDVEAYNIELKDDEGFIGDRANKGAFRAFIDEWRKPLHEIGQDPFGDTSSHTLTKKELDVLLTSGDLEAAAIVHGAIESFAQELALVIQRFLKVKGWKDVERLVIVGIGCPGKIEPDGSIDRGAQNLPGNWESSRFNLPATLTEAIPAIGEFETTVVMHNDAVVQGLSEVPSMQDIEKWGIFTIGTGLGNALYANPKVASSTPTPILPQPPCVRSAYNRKPPTEWGLSSHS